MATQFNSDGSFNEILFENKNKAYGAYEIRKSYNDTVTKSLLITLGCVCALFLSLFFMTDKSDKIPAIQGNIPPIIFDMGKEIFVQPIEKPKMKVEPIEKPEPVKSETGILMASDNKEDLLNKTNEDFKIAKINNEKGADSIAGQEPKDPGESNLTPEDNEPKKWVDQMPEFNGNVYQFIMDHMSYPPIAKENGTQGMVALSFVVEKDGSINDIKILKDLGDGCSKEAIRVLRMMPKWKPGKNHGEPVRVQYNLPIKFKLQN